MDAPDVFRLGVSVREKAAMNDFLLAVDEMPHDAFVAAVMLLTMLAHTCWGER